MVNNIDKIREQLKFDGENDFYFIQLLQRNKEHPGTRAKANVIKTYYIVSLEHFDKKIPEIRHLCDYYIARAYMFLNRRNFKKIALEHMHKMMEYVIQNKFTTISRLYDTTCCKYHSEPKATKMFMIDIDYEDFDYSGLDELTAQLNSIIETVKSLVILSGRDPNEVYILPTRNGQHIITPPFNRHKFQETYPKISTYTDQGTLLYIGG